MPRRVVDNDPIGLRYDRIVEITRDNSQNIIVIKMHLSKTIYDSLKIYADGIPRCPLYKIIHMLIIEYSWNQIRGLPFY